MIFRAFISLISFAAVSVCRLRFVAFHCFMLRFASPECALFCHASKMMATFLHASVSTYLLSRYSAIVCRQNAAPSRRRHTPR
jgi:hypothetical protein